MTHTEYEQQATRQLEALDQGLAAIGQPQNDAETWLYTALDAFLRDYAKYDRQARKQRGGRVRYEARDIALMILGLVDLAVRDLHRVRIAKTKPTVEELAASYHYKTLALLPKDGSLPPHVANN